MKTRSLARILVVGGLFAGGLVAGGLVAGGCVYFGVGIACDPGLDNCPANLVCSDEGVCAPGEGEGEGEGEDLDGGAPDPTVPDAGVPDAGVPDAGGPDGGAPDAGGDPDGGVIFEPDAGAPSCPLAGVPLDSVTEGPASTLAAAPAGAVLDGCVEGDHFSLGGFEDTNNDCPFAVPGHGVDPLKAWRLRAGFFVPNDTDAATINLFNAAATGPDTSRELQVDGGTVQVERDFPGPITERAGITVATPGAVFVEVIHSATGAPGALAFYEDESYARLARVVPIPFAGLNDGSGFAQLEARGAARILQYDLDTWEETDHRPQGVIFASTFEDSETDFPESALETALGVAVSSGNLVKADEDTALLSFQPLSGAPRRLRVKLSLANDGDSVTVGVRGLGFVATRAAGASQVSITGVPGSTEIASDAFEVELIYDAVEDTFGGFVRANTIVPLPCGARSTELDDTGSGSITLEGSLDPAFHVAHIFVHDR